MDNTTFGLRPIDWSGPEIIESYYWSSAPYAVSAAVNSNVQLFQQGQFSGNAAGLQNYTLPPSINRRVRVLAQMCEDAIGFTQGTGATVGSVQTYFKSASYFLWQIESKDNSQFRVGDLSQTYNSVFGITQAANTKQSQYWGLNNPLDLPAQGEVKCTFVPAPALPVTSATASVNVPGLGYTNDVGHYVKLILWVLLARP